MGKRNPQIRKPMTPCERGNWIDTEGNIGADLRGRFVIDVAQVEREPLEDYCNGARRDGVECRVRYDRTARVWIARITGAENVAREVSLTRDCMRTARKHAQIQALTQQLTRPRIIALRPSIKSALEILGLPPEVPRKPRRRKLGRPRKKPIL